MVGSRVRNTAAGSRLALEDLHERWYEAEWFHIVVPAVTITLVQAIAFTFGLRLYITLIALSLIVRILAAAVDNWTTIQVMQMNTAFEAQGLAPQYREGNRWLPDQPEWADLILFEFHPISLAALLLGLVLPGVMMGAAVSRLIAAKHNELNRRRAEQKLHLLDVKSGWELETMGKKESGQKHAL